MVGGDGGGGGEGLGSGLTSNSKWGSGGDGAENTFPQQLFINNSKKKEVGPKQLPADITF